MASSLFKVSPPRPLTPPPPPTTWTYKFLETWNSNLFYLLRELRSNWKVYNIIQRVGRGGRKKGKPGQQTCPLSGSLVVYVCMCVCVGVVAHKFYVLQGPFCFSLCLEWRMSCAGWANCNSFTVWGQLKGVAGPSKTCQFSDECIAGRMCVYVCVCVSMCPLTARWKAKDFHPICKSGASRYAYATFARLAHTPRWLFAWLDALRHVSQKGWRELTASRARRQVKHYNITRFPIHLWKSFSLLTFFFGNVRIFRFYYLPYPVNVQQGKGSTWNWYAAMQGNCQLWHTPLWQQRVLRAFSFCFFFSLVCRICLVKRWSKRDKH